ncbi:DNA polymerase III subunit delta' [Candidatus Dactylopiibacterium carminicum]|nr:DNA polymerase III subunit delta' [Candidatus Dactylopiibacterium carminicum]
MTEMLPPWLLPAWQAVRARGARLPHALLLTGPAGSGKRLFGERLAQALLCTQPDAQGFACGQCKDCNWIAGGNHPDHFLLVPAADEAAEEEAEEGGKKEKTRSTQIVIDQVRQLQSALEVGAGGHAGGRRVVLIDPAEAMNVAAANALLKSLEEPGENTVFILASDAPRKLLATIRSRCQVIEFMPPPEAQAQAWLQAQDVADDALLGFAGGLPLAAKTLATPVWLGLRRKLAEDLAQLGQRDPLRLAAEWEARLKAKDALEAGFAMPTLIDWVQRWLADGARVASGATPRFYADFAAALQAQTRIPLLAWLESLRELDTHRRSASHPLNPRLFLEDLFLSMFRRLRAH